ncbi:MAG: 16S rRNA (cytosine(1402)-N(4))-methyltransferase [Pseudomonadales bacterium]|nr:MAG: 16S rRNA (cytosine(1402)-N(4))-methyltransferase [Pseudomonadales bacterium]
MEILTMNTASTSYDTIKHLPSIVTVPSNMTNLANITRVSHNSSNSLSSSLPNSLSVPVNANIQPDVISYYSETSEDYRGWSKSYHMHFGYFRFNGWGHFIKNIWRLEPQLNQASEEVFQKLAVKEGGHYLDMGCGYGATARLFAKQYPKSKLTGISLVASQVQEAQSLLKAESPNSINKVDFKKMDYQDTAFADESFDGVYAMESACHGRGEGRGEFLAEAFRLLKPNGTLVVHDAFTSKLHKKELHKTTGLNFIYNWAYHWLCKGWAVEDYINKEAFEAELVRQGFQEIHFKNAFWNVLPSALHMPRIILTYFLQKMLFSKDFYRNKGLRKQRINHCLGSFSAMIVALHVRRFNYYVVTARKGNNQKGISS